MASLSEEKLTAIIQQRLSLKDFQLKRFIGKYLELLINFDKNEENSLDLLGKEALQELEMLEFQIMKAEMAHYIRLKDQSYYNELNSEISKEIAIVKAEIEEKQRILQLETEKKKIRCEYDLIAEEIIRYDEKKTMNERLCCIEEEIKDLESTYHKNLEHVERKEKELFLIVSLIISQYFQRFLFS